VRRDQDDALQQGDEAQVADADADRGRGPRAERVESFSGILDKLQESPEDPEQLAILQDYVKDCDQEVEELAREIGKAREKLDLLEAFEFDVDREDFELYWQAYSKPREVDTVRKAAIPRQEEDRVKFMQKLQELANEFQKELQSIDTDVNNFFTYNDLEQAEEYSGQVMVLNQRLLEAAEQAQVVNSREKLFDFPQTSFDEIESMVQVFKPYADLWSIASEFQKSFPNWMYGPFNTLDAEQIETNVTTWWKFAWRAEKTFDGKAEPQSVAATLKERLDTFKPNLPLIAALRNPGMRDRHWTKLSTEVGEHIYPDVSLTLKYLLEIDINKHEQFITTLSEQAAKEYGFERTLDKMKTEWRDLQFEFSPYKDSGTYVLKGIEETVMLLDDQIVKVQAMRGSPYAKPLEAVVIEWSNKLVYMQDVLEEWLKCQKTWLYLEPIFASPDIMRQMPTEGRRFQKVDQMWRSTMQTGADAPAVMQVMTIDNLKQHFLEANKTLDLVQKGLNDYLETKRSAFPRFYFLSNDELLDILSETKDPRRVVPHMPKCFEGICGVKMKGEKEEQQAQGGEWLNITHMVSGEGEVVALSDQAPVEPDADRNRGNVERWLLEMEGSMRVSLREIGTDAINKYKGAVRTDFVQSWTGMIVLAADCLYWTKDVEESMLAHGVEGVKKMEQQMVQELADIVELVRGELSKQARLIIGAMVVLDVHNKDVTSLLVQSKVSSPAQFDWNSQLRYYQETIDGKEAIMTRMMNASLAYSYEYLGNSMRLVVTPLTDRCYRTLMGALHLSLGGAPEGPAGTGKTETVKDLSKAVAKQCVVFNCSDGLDYLAMAKFFKGLASCGAWACFDEFNRIDLEVLSVIAQQILTLTDGLRRGTPRIVFEGSDIPLVRGFSSFITMNPGYAGRTELPESVKALFRPCAMIVPDMDLICEIMLMSEGYSEGKVLARKFMMLYRLSEALLSQQKHYDWKLRAVKTTLNVAGSMRRNDRENTEDRVLLRALRDFNLGKLVMDDVGIFVGMIDDLFPKQREHVVRARELDFEEKISEASKTMYLQPEDIFVLKCSQLREIAVVRWSVFVLGPAGCGKSEMIKVLSKAQNLFGEKATINVLNPKSVTRNELYGYIHPATREWKDGLLSQIFRDLANTFTCKSEYLVLDGDIDAEWIESMNTVMDDNKTLTLASNERIPLTPPMRLLLEIENMREASPATVSRGGVIFMNDTDVGWAPFVTSWISNREYDVEKGMLRKLFEQYVGTTFEWMRKNCATVVPLPEINRVQHLCYILQGILNNGDNFAGQCKSMGIESAQQLLESYFTYACVWSLGGGTFADKQFDHRKAFDRFWRDEFKTIRFPDDGSVFDYCVSEDMFPLKLDNEILSTPFIPWVEKVPTYSHSPMMVFGNIYVATMETQRLTYLLDLLMPNKHACMFVGGAGTGKTTIMADKLRNMDVDAFAFMNINLNCFTDSMLLQGAMESVLEKKTGRTFGPTGSKKMVYFIDDINMPQVDKYGTQQPIALLRQLFDYDGWYSRDKLTWRDIQNVQAVSCLNPTAGSFYIDPRLQRSYCTYAVQMPAVESLFVIFNSILQGHFATFGADIQKKGEEITKATMDLQTQVASTFFPTAIKFHYIFNLRDVGNIFEGLLRSTPAYYTGMLPMARLWMHECERVFSDRMITAGDMEKFKEMLDGVAKKYFDFLAHDKVTARPNIFTTFTTPGANDDERPYCGIDSEEKLQGIMAEKLKEYNEVNAVMDLVLFTMAIEHVCRITRVIDKPRGNALLVGVGGSGKQSLSKLSASICLYEIFQITVTATYGINDFKENLIYLFTRAGVKGIGTCFILTDGQIVNERMMVFLNDLLASGNIPDIFTKDIKDEFSNAVRNEVKQAGLQDTAENLWDFFIEKTRKFLHLCLCFSPVGDKFRVRARQFPALINCTTFDFFHPWPQDALESVATRFIKGVDGILDDDVPNVAAHMAYVHQGVNTASELYQQSERRYNYTTPKSYLDLIDLYKTMLASKKEAIQQLKERLTNGLEKMNSAAEQVAELQENLVKDMAIVEEKKEATDKLLVVVGQETNIAEEQKAGASVEEQKCEAIAQEVMAFQAECEKEMAAAEPVIQAAVEALNSLDKKSITELKALASPPAGVDDVTAGVLVLMGGGKIPKDVSWGAAKKLMGNVDQFLNALIAFDKDNTPVIACEWIEKNLLSGAKGETFTPEVMKSKSSAAAGMCGWVINIVKYFRIYQVVEPKRQLLAEANTKLDDANTKLAGVRAQVAALEAKLAELNQQFETATQEKNDAIAAADKTQRKAEMAKRLVNGLADENVRWTEAVKSFDVQEAQYVGDVLVASAFVSYIGAFNAKYRNSLVFDQWINDMTERKIPMTEGIVPLAMLCDDAEVAVWNGQGLPTDSVSVQNGAIIANCKRWPLLIDPQLQGIKWIRKKHTEQVPESKPDDWNEEEKGEFVPNPENETTKEMRCVQLTQGKYLNAVELAIQNGEPIMIENIREDIDAVLDPVLMRSVIRRGRAMVIKLGDKEVEYDPRFQLYLQTKLSNPHYKPEIAAQTTLINFMITLDGLEEQLLALVVNKERPDLEEQKVALMEQQNGFKVKLKSLEDELLFRLSSSQGDILEDIELIEGLERAKVTATEIAAKQIIAKETEVTITHARKAYVPVAVRGALTYFLIDQLWVLDHMYRFSMANFVTIFKKGMDVADLPPEEGEGGEGGEAKPAEGGGDGKVDLNARVAKLVDTSCFTCFSYVAQGLFERHKLVFACQLCFQVQQRSGDLNGEMFDFLIKGPRASGIDNPLNEWLDDSAWLTCQALKEFEAFEKLPDDMVGSAKRFREWFELERPEEVGLPGDWKKLPEFEKLLLIRALRTDRMSEALSAFVRQIMGAKYITSQPFNLEKSYKDVSPQTPVFFILSAGVDPVKDTERLGKDLGYGFDFGNFGLVSLGQGQEPVAEKAIETAYKGGGWAFLQNIHLTPRWTGGYLEKRCDDLDSAHEEFRMFLSAEPAKLPINILQVCVKLTNEPPEGLQANLRKNWLPFSDDFFESSAKPGELKSITFALCLFHSVVIERKKFGPQGWNRVYPFNFGDLTSCAQVAMNYLEANPKVPWDDLRYIFGEIMYGGHVTDFFDRRLVSNYLAAYMHDELLEGFDIFPGFRTPSNSGNTKDILEHIAAAFPQESPTAFGLHPNAEIGFRLMQADTMFNNIRELQPRGSGMGGGMSVTEKAKAMLDDIMEKLPDQFEMLEILDRVEERTPYINVFLQEIERMQELTIEIKRSLAELDLGLKGDLQISEPMEKLMNSLADLGRPEGWEKYAFPSKRMLGSWIADLLMRHKQLMDWTGDMGLPKSTWLSGLFNPQSFLTAVLQTTARKNDWPLDKTVTQTEVTKKNAEEITAASKEGAFIHGLFMEGARWDDKAGCIEESRPKELYAKIPVVMIKAAMFTGVEQKDTYICPVYKTQDRGPTFVFNAGLRSKTPPSKWILGGVGLLMDVS